MAAEKKDIVKKVETKSVAAAPAAAKSAKAETKVVEVKSEEPKAAAKKEPAAEKPAVSKKAEEPVKAAGSKKTVVKKTATAKVEPKASVILEYGEKQILAKDVLDKALKAFAKANKGVTVKKIEVYMKPEDGVAYYVVNGVGSEDYKVEL